MARATKERRPDQDEHRRLAIAAILVGLLLFVGAYFVLPQVLIDSREMPARVKGLKPPERIKLELQAANDEDKLQNDVRTTAVQGLGGLVLVLGSYFTLRSLRLTREVHVTDTFSTAIGHMQAKELVARLGGIHALERVARMSRYDHASVVDVLTAFVREHAPIGAKKPSAVDRASVQAAMTTLGRLNRDRDPPGQRLNLTSVDLSGLVLHDANLQQANLTDSDLRRARLFGANLEGALLVRADLRGAALAEAECKGASLEEAHLEGADIQVARSLDAKPVHCGADVGPHDRTQP